jgi:FimV-like protein
LLPLRTLFEVDHKSPHYNERNKQSIFYAQSWALMHYMIIGKPGRVEQLGKFLDLLNSNTPKEQAFQQAFETSFETVEKELREYVQKDRYNILNGHFKNKLETDAGMTSKVISEAEAQAYLGDLLLHSNRKDSMKYLQKALELDPDLALANAAMGMAMLREDKLDDALKHLERAVKASNQNYLVHYYYAYALSQQKSSSTPDLAPSLSADLGEKIRAELLKAIKLRPDYPTSYSLLGYISLLTGNNLEESTKLLTQALRSSPGRTELAFMLGQLYMRSGDYKQARTLLEQVVKSKAEDDTRRHAEMMLNQLVNFIEQQARYEEQRRSQPKQTSDSISLSRENLNRTQSTASETVPLSTPRDQFSYLREILRQPQEGEKQVQGSLLGVKCEGKGLVFVVKTEAETLRLFTQSFEQMTITTYTPSVSGDITCGDRKGDESVVVVFGQNTNAKLKVTGTIKSIEFVPEKFKLNSN